VVVAGNARLPGPRSTGQWPPPHGRLAGYTGISELFGWPRIMFRVRAVDLLAPLPVH